MLQMMINKPLVKEFTWMLLNVLKLFENLRDELELTSALWASDSRLACLQTVED